MMSTPAIRAIRQAFPKAYITSLASRKAQAVLEGNPYLDGLIEYPGKFKRTMRLIKEIRRRRFDLVVILHGNDPDIVPLVYLSGAKYRVGWAESQLAFLLTHPAPQSSTYSHFIHQKLALAQMVGATWDDPRMELFLLPGEEEKAKTFLAEQGIGLNDLVVTFNPGGSRPSKWWPVESFACLGDQTIEKFGAKIVLLGSSQETGLIHAIAGRMQRRPICVVGQPIRLAAAILRHSRLLVSTDNGFMHIALALNVPTIALFGPSDPKLVGPLETEGWHAVIRGKASGEGNSGWHLMEAIRVEEVLSLVQKRLC